MRNSSLVTTISVADARDGLSRTLKRFRSGAEPEPVVLGSHRKPEAVLIPYRDYVHLTVKQEGASGVLNSLQARADLIRRLASLSNLESVSVFGSVARGDETAGSDIDLLVDPARGATLFDFAQFATDMESLMGRPVDVVSRKSLDPTTDKHILEEAVRL